VTHSLFNSYNIVVMLLSPSGWRRGGAWPVRGGAYRQAQAGHGKPENRWRRVASRAKRSTQPAPQLPTGRGNTARSPAEWSLKVPLRPSGRSSCDISAVVGWKRLLQVDRLPLSDERESGFRPPWGHRL